VEYWDEDGNWQFADPMIGLTQPMRTSIVVLSIAGPEDESKSFGTGRLAGVRPGTPYLSVPEISGGLTGGSSAIQVGLHFYRTFPFAAGARILTAGYRRSSRVILAARQGHSLPLDEAEFQKALLAPEPFWKLLDSK
jgi:hypothetical protein